LVGTAAFLASGGPGAAPGPEALAAAARLSEEGKTAMFAAVDGRYAGLVAAADRPRPTAAAAVAALRSMGIRVAMISGDGARTARAIAREVGIDEVLAEVLPGGKAAAVARLRSGGSKVAMVGDGINDAPALASADLGIAIGAGSDVAIESAGLVLARSDPADAATALRLSRNVMRNIKQNLFWAFAYNVLGIPVAAGLLSLLGGPLLDPMLAAAAMSMSSVSVLANALRLRRFRAAWGGSAESSRLPPAGGERKSVMTKKLSIEGMSCMHCAGRVQKALAASPGVRSAKVDLEAKLATVEGEELSDAALSAAVAEAGYSVVRVD